MLKRRSSMHNDSLFLFSPDIIVKVISVILQSIELETLVMTNNLTHLWSPQTAADFRWLLLRFSEAFIYFAEDHSASVSPSLHAVLGQFHFLF